MSTEIINSFLDSYKEYCASKGIAYDEAKAKKVYKEVFTDPEVDSFVAQWNGMKALFNNTAEKGYKQLLEYRNNVVG